MATQLKTQVNSAIRKMTAKGSKNKTAGRSCSDQTKGTERDEGLHRRPQSREGAREGLQRLIQHPRKDNCKAVDQNQTLELDSWHTHLEGLAARKAIACDPLSSKCSISVLKRQD